MNDLVYLKKNEPFTDSLVIAEQTGNQHSSVARLIKTQKKRLEKFGELRFSDLKSINPKGGRPARVYLLNEQQATLLITFLDNTDKVADFKTELVRQFYEMRQFILERQTETWEQTRHYGKLTRKAETDTIQKLVEYAKEQGSEHSDKLYVTYTKLANKMAGVDKRDEATVKQLNDLSLMENIILHIIDMGILAQKHYKDIYKDCKRRLETVKDMAFIGEEQCREQKLMIASR